MLGIFRPKNPPASAWFEPANLGTKAITLPLYHRRRPVDITLENVEEIRTLQNPELDLKKRNIREKFC